MKNRIAFWILCFVLSAACGVLGSLLAHWMLK
nr:MAG TPA: NICKEL AND COBALT RESISTANCE PROTEIN BINDING PROTEIN, SENSOR PROTEIN [Caudoviricetes sp.]